MRDRDTVIRSHGRADRRVSVEMQTDAGTLTLFFDAATAWSGAGPLLEIRLTPMSGGKLEPAALMPDLPLYLQYARAALAHKRGDAQAALRALRETNAPRRGLTDDFLRAVADSYRALVAEGEKYPISALARLQPADVSTASRWVTEARRRGFLPAKGDER